MLPPPSVTISQLTATEILELYQKNLPIFNEEKTQTFENVYDSEASNFTTAASTPPRHIEDLSSEPVMVESFKNAFENTITETFDSVPPLSDDKKTYEPVRSFQGFLCNNADEEMVKNTPWPQILHCRYYSVQ